MANKLELTWVGKEERIEVEPRILIEVPDKSFSESADIIAKKKRGIQYCQVATNWGKANGYKAWQYLFIPSMQIKESSTFSNLSKMFAEK